MNPPTHKPKRGASLMESVISIGVLAVAVPMILAGMTESGRSGEASGAETRAPWIAAACFDELRAAAIGRSEFFEADSEGRVEPPPSGLWALGFSRGGSVLEKLSPGQYSGGIKATGSDPVRFIAKVHPTMQPPASGSANPSVSTMRVSVEYPATAPADKRRILDFHAHIR